MQNMFTTIRSTLRKISGRDYGIKFSLIGIRISVKKKIRVENIISIGDLIPGIIIPFSAILSGQAGQQATLAGAIKKHYTTWAAPMAG